MRTAETILNIIRERGQRGSPVEDVYRLLYNPDLYLRAYAKLNSNAGAMTPELKLERERGKDSRYPCKGRSSQIPGL